MNNLAEWRGIGDGVWVVEAASQIYIYRRNDTDAARNRAERFKRDEPALQHATIDSIMNAPMGVSPKINNMNGSRLDRVVLSMQHSGTRTLCNLLNCGHFHTFAIEHPEVEDFPENIFIACPLRNPREMWASWAKRWEIGITAVDLGLFKAEFEYLSIFDDMYDIHYIPIDLPPRDDILAEWSDLLDESLVIDWGDRKGHIEGSTETDHPEPDWDYIYNLPFVKRFYVA